MNNLLKTLHNWGGFLIFIPLFLTCFTGGILGVADLIDRADDKGQIYTPMSPAEKSLMYTQLLQKDNEFTRFRTPHESRPYASAFSRGHTKFYDTNLQLIDERIRTERPVMNGIFFFHRHFLIGSNGFIVNGIVSLLSALFILIGLYLWWSKYRGLSMKRSVPKSFRPRDLLNSHILAGVVIALPFLVLSYTGFHLVFGEDIFGRNNNTLSEKTTITFTPNDIEAQINEAQALWPEKDLVSVVRVVERVRSGKSAQGHSKNSQKNGSRAQRPQVKMTGLELRFSDQYYLSPQGANSLKIDLSTGRLVEKTLFVDLPISEKLKAYVRPLHDGLNLPSLYVVLITLTSFLASIILLFSAYTFAKRLIRSNSMKRN